MAPRQRSLRGPRNGFITRSGKTGSDNNPSNTSRYGFGIRPVPEDRNEDEDIGENEVKLDLKTFEIPGSFSPYLLTSNHRQ